MSPVKLLHCFTVGKRPRFMVKFLGVLVKNLYRRNVISLALCASAYGFCLFDGTRSLLQLCCAWRCPDRVVVAHRDSPVSHAAARVSDRNFGERLFSFFILERME